MTDDGRRDLYEAMMLAVPDGIVAVDADGRVRACNPAAAALLERSADELVGSAFGLPLGDGQSAEVTLALPNGGNKVVEMTVTRARFDGSRLYVAALRDGTRRQQADHVLQAALEHQSAVVAVAAHQLHNPLAALGALVHVLREPPPDLTDERRAEVIERIAERTARLQALVHKLLTAARIDGASQPGAPEPVQVRGFLLEQLAESGVVGRGLRLAVPAHLVVRVDRVGFSEILGNYLENAFAHGLEPVEITARENDGRVELRVADHGPGVPESFVPHLFERYRRDPATAAATEGTGLGLWIARSLARADGGDAWYEPGRPSGAVFCVSLPQEPGPPRPQAAARPAPPPPSSRA
ncbi:ATP-binding protein [Streptomyces sp. CWNU-52B]|uniref:sensor histidine kinase n=1 Tax=unclassified Streptomyces TaxID=2593676 RepID=UPI0039C06A23